MAISRAQMEEQIRGFRDGGGATLNDPLFDFLREPEPDPFAFTPIPQNIQDDIDADFERLLQEQAKKLLEEAAASAASAGPNIEVPKFEERFPLYQDRLKEVMGERERPSFYDLAATVGEKMLSADPATGAFTSLGQGLAEFSKEERERKLAEQKEDRAIALKAFELAQEDESRARDLLNEYEVYKAKKDPANEIEFYRVTDPVGIQLGRKTYAQGDKIPLTDPEAFKYREKIEPTGSKGVKTPLAGMFAKYLTKEKAKEMVELYGITPDMPGYEDSVTMLTAPTPASVGKPILVGSSYGKIVPFVVDGDVRSLLLDANKDAGEPAFVSARKKRLDEIGKQQTKFNENYATIFPTIEEAMEILLANQNLTGPYEAIEKPAMGFIANAFGIEDEEFQSFKRLDAITNRVGPLMRPTGSGSTSDMEFESYKQAIASLKNPAIVNYISLYAFLKTSENNMKINEEEARLLQEGKFTNTIDIAEEAKKADAGVFAKYYGDSDDNAQIEYFYESLPRGAVILNKSQKDGGALFLLEDGTPAGPYIVKGWGGFNANRATK